MNYTSLTPTFDYALFEEFYGVQPQAITWMRPIWNKDNTSIIDFEYTYCNQQGLNYLNLTRQQHDGLRLSVTPTLNDEMRQNILAEMAAVFLTGEASQRNVYNPVLNKYIRVLRTKLREGVLSVIQDRSEEMRMLKQQEEDTRRLEEQKNLLDNIMKNSSNGISVSRVFRDEGGKVVDALTVMANDAAVRYIGLPKDIYLSKRATEIEPAVMDSPYYQACINTLATGEPFMMQYQMQSTERWLELTVSRLDKDHLIQIFTDVTAIKQAQLTSEQSAERLRAVFNASQSGMFIFAPVRNENGEIIDFRFVLANPSFAAYVNQTPDVLRGELGSTFFPGYLHNGVFDMYRQTYLTGETLRREVHYNVDIHDLYLDLMSTKVQDEVLVTFTDFTTIKKTQLQLERFVEELRQSNTRLEEFANAASHDLKEPIRKIHVFTGRLKASLVNKVTELEQKMFDRVQDATDRMSILVDDLLTYSQVSMKDYEMEEVDLNEKIQSVLTDLEVPIEEKGAIITVTHLPIVKGYRRQLQQLFQNLLSNALKYSRHEVTPHITVTSSTITGADVPAAVPYNQHFHLIEVADNGIGFEQEYADRIFQMFQRLHGKSEFAGTGVGLAIARKVAENHNGFIWAEGNPGNGATFKLVLPA